jgi:gamma-glutamyltranspeptidase/glutathione hydrolase
MPEPILPTRRRLTAAAAAVFVLLSVCLVTSSSSQPATVTGTSIDVPNAIVVTADSIASAVGNRVLLDGGNAVDAAVAVGFALAVTLPRAGNIGGGGFLLVRLADGEENFVDYRERAPSGANRDMYLDKNGQVTEGLSLRGHMASAVPGTVYGLAFAHEAYGTLPWRDLVAPAVRLAREGFVVPPSLVRSLARKRALLEKHEETRRVFVSPEYRPGDRLVQPELAATLERIADDWRDFYTGQTAGRIVAEMKNGGGLITMEDLASYSPVLREPVRFRYRDADITGPPLPSSGGVILAQIFQMFEILGGFRHERGSAPYVHLLSELEKIAYRSRALYLGDLDFYPSPWQRLASRQTAEQLAALVSADKILKVRKLDSHELLPAPAAGESEETTHYSIVDRWGNAVANTYTLNGSYGSGVMVNGAGFLLNNQMDDFAIKPGYPNDYGLVGSDANAIEPGKRMLSSMAPTFVYREGELYMLLGSPGGATIPTAVLQVIVNVVDHGMPLYDAVSAKRFHEQYLPDRIYIENGALAPEVVDELLEMGHKIMIRKPIGRVNAVLIENGRLTGASDPRGAGLAIGH